MDVELLEQLQVSRSRVRTGGAVGLINGFRIGSKNRTVRIKLLESGDMLEVAPEDLEIVDPVDPSRVAAAAERREQEALGFQIARSIANQVPMLP